MYQILFKIPAFHLAGRSFPGFYIYTYGVMMAVAFAVGLLVAAKRAKDAGFPADKIADAAIVVLIAGVVGSRLLFILEDWRDYVGNFWDIFNIREGGLSIHGGLIFGFLAGLWYTRKYKLDFWKGADIMAPAIAIGMGIGRIGCFFNGCCVGTPCAWGFVFKANPNYFGPRHPTQLYSMALDFLIAGILMTGFKRAKTGTTFLWLCILASISRFFVEFLRADAIPAGPLSLVQWICLAIIGVASFVLVRRSSSVQLSVN